MTDRKRKHSDTEDEEGSTSENVRVSCDDDGEEDCESADSEALSDGSDEDEDSSCSDEESDDDLNEEDEKDTEADEDPLIVALRRAVTTKRSNPPDIKYREPVTAISFSPISDTLLLGTLNGDICLYSYNMDKVEKLKRYVAHMGSVRCAQYADDGKSIYTASSDKSIILSDAHSGKFVACYDNAHEFAIYSMAIIDDNVFVTGDDGGTVKIWDKRQRDAIYSVRECADYISALCTNSGKKVLACATGGGSLFAINLNARKIYQKCGEMIYSADFTCAGLFKSETKLAVGANNGSILTYDWTDFQEWNDEFPSVDKRKPSLNCMIPITDNIAIAGYMNGEIRAINLYPMKHLGIVGNQGRSNSVEMMDLSRNGRTVAAISHDKRVTFWNVGYFEDFEVNAHEKADKKKAKVFNLPSSKGINKTEFFSGLT